MKRLLLTLSLLIPSIAFAGSPDFVVTNGTAVVNPTTQGAGGSAGVDRYGNLQCSITGTSPGGIGVSSIPISNAVGLNGIGSPVYAYASITNLTCTAGSTTTCTVTSSSPRVGDLIEGNSGTTANIGVSSVVTAASGTVITVSPAFPAAIAASDSVRLLRPVPIQSSYSSSVGSNSLLVTATASRDNWVQLEDNASATGDMLAKTGLVTESAITAKTSTTGDWGVTAGDMGGRPVITYAPAGETWQSCGTATASTADTAIKASVASNRIYVTNITCKNTSATVASSLDFKDGTTVIAVGGISQMAAGAAGSFDATFPVPLRGTSATALNFATNISVSSVTCCASGYVSTL